ncbi:MAG: hypothetical protein WC310_02000 [Patescibacteria group bacterium]|jgi:hypothetical protein
MTNNAIRLITKDLQNHKVYVVLPGEEEERFLYLIMMQAKTSRLEDFEVTFGQQITEFQRKLALKIFGRNQTDNIYGVFLDDNLKMIFAFNRVFADYDGETKRVNYKDIDDLLIDLVKKVDPDSLSSVFEQGLPSGRPFGPGGGQGMLRYSLPDKKNKKKK